MDSKIILNGIYNFLNYINDNWVMITTIIGLAIMVGNKARDYLNKSNEEKIAIAKAQIQEIMLRLVTEAECDYSQWIKAGSIKRSQVIDQIFSMYPVLSKVATQEDIIVWIDDTINAALKEMRKIFEENAKKDAEDQMVDTVVENESIIEG